MVAAFVMLNRRLGFERIYHKHGLWRPLLVLLPHVAAFAIMMETEGGPVTEAAFILAWGILNFFWLALTRRPLVAGLLSLAMLTLLIVLSKFKYRELNISADFVDVMIIDKDTFGFLLRLYPNLRWYVPSGLIALATVVVFAWRLDSFRVHRLVALVALPACVGGLTLLGMQFPFPPYYSFYSGSEVSNFARSGVEAVSAWLSEGFLESDPTSTRLPLEAATCRPKTRPPHLILIHDESSFDMRRAPGIKLPAGYGSHFLSFDGRERNFIAEGAGGPSWYTEYNVLDGLSARTFGRFAYFVTRLAAGRVKRGLPGALVRCGYRTFSLYTLSGGFLSERSFQTTAGVQHFFDVKDLNGPDEIGEPDSFYYDAASDLIKKQYKSGPMFVYVYLEANHFPWDVSFRDDLTPEWTNPGNDPPVDEYLRRQSASAQQYSDFLARLKHDFPDDSFLLVRYGDHQPYISQHLLEPDLTDEEIAQRLMKYDPRYYTTYYAIDAINFTPVDVSSALDTLEGPYLPIVMQEAAGLPLDPSFAEQKKILIRCKGLFYGCDGGAEARRFNRVLIEAGLIERL